MAASRVALVGHVWCVFKLASGSYGKPHFQSSLMIPLLTELFNSFTFDVFHDTVNADLVGCTFGVPFSEDVHRQLLGKDSLHIHACANAPPTHSRMCKCSPTHSDTCGNAASHPTLDTHKLYQYLKGSEGLQQQRLQALFNAAFLKLT